MPSRKEMIRYNSEKLHTKKAPELPSAQKLNSQNMKLADHLFAQTMMPVTLPYMSSLCKPSSEVFMNISFVSPA